MTRYVLLFCGLAIFQNVIGQKIYSFKYDEDYLDESEIVEVDLKKHYLGDKISRKMLLLLNSYTWLEDPTPMSPSPRRIVEKYPIYNSVKRLNAYYKKKMKKEGLSHAEAEAKLSRAIDIALCIRYQNTVAFEEVLDQTKDIKALENIYTSNVILQGSDKYGAALSSVDD